MARALVAACWSAAVYAALLAAVAAPPAAAQLLGADDALLLKNLPPRQTAPPALLDRSAWSATADSAEQTAAANASPGFAIDGNNGTFWHSRYSAPAAALPHSLTIDMNVPFFDTSYRTSLLAVLFVKICPNLGFSLNKSVRVSFRFCFASDCTGFQGGVVADISAAPRWQLQRPHWPVPPGAGHHGNELRRRRHWNLGR